MKQSLIYCAIIFPSICYSEQVINLASDKDVAFDVLNKTWVCDMQDSMAGELGVWSLHYSGGNQVTGSITIPKYTMCNSDRLEGRIKGNLVTYFAYTKGFCGSIIGNIKFFSDEENKYYANGHYTYGGTRKRGTYNCELQTNPE